MIEVEKKFQPTEEQEQAMLEHAEFLGKIVNHDVYYDYADYRLFKKGIRLRNRNGEYELKIGGSDGVAEEIENDSKIRDYFKTAGTLDEFTKTEMIKIVEYKTTRRKYKKEGFTIDIDRLDFGFSVCEIELLVEHETEISQAEDKICEFAKRYNLEIKKLPSKRGEYLRLFNTDAYNEIYGK